MYGVGSRKSGVGWKRPGGTFKIRSTEEITKDKVRSSYKGDPGKYVEENSWDNKT